MKEDQIDIRYAYLLPWPFRLLAALILIIGVALAVEKTVVAILLICASGFILTGYEGTIINKTSCWYSEYKSFFFLKSGKKLKYSGVEKIFINSSRTTQRLNATYSNHSSTFMNVQFNGFIKFMGGEKIKLKSKPSKTEILRSLQSISLFLKIPIEDNTGQVTTDTIR